MPSAKHVQAAMKATPAEAGNRLRAWRESKGLSATTLAEQLGLAQSSVWRLEAGRTAFTEGVLMKLAKMGVSLDWLLVGRGELPGVTVPPILPIHAMAAQDGEFVEVPFYTEPPSVPYLGPQANAGGMVRVPASMVPHPDRAFLWVVRADDMSPIIQPGFTVCVCANEKCWLGDDLKLDQSIVAIMTKEGPRLRWCESTKAAWVFSGEKEGVEIITAPRSLPPPIVSIVLFWIGQQVLPTPHKPSA
jgi:transcriptional regulator with XRE-family HTH domain